MAVVAGATAVAGGLVAALARLDTAGTFWLAVLWIAWGGGLAWGLTRRPVSMAFVALWGWQLVYLVVGATSASWAGQTQIGSWVFRAGVTPAVRMITVSIAAVWAGAAVVHLVGAGRPFGRRAGARSGALSGRGAAGRGVAGRRVAGRRTASRAPSRASAAGDPARVPVAVPAMLTARRLDRWALVLVVLAAAGLVLYVRLAGASLADLNVLGGSAVYGDLGRAGEGAAVKYFKTMNELAGVALMLLAVRVVVVSRRNWLRPVLIGAVATGLLIMSGGRAWLFVPAFAAALLVWRTSSARWTRQPRRWLVLAGVAAFAVAAVVGGIRGQADDRTLDGQSLVTKEVIGIFPPTAGLAETMPRQMDHLGGASYVELLALPVPRALWPDKPDTVLGDVQLAIFGKGIGASFGFHGELFANFGMVGVVLGSFLFGVAYEAAWRALVRTRRFAPTLLWAVALAVLLQIFTRGYVAGQLAGQFGLVVGALAVAWLLTRRSGRDVASAAAPIRDGGVGVAS